MGRRSDKDGWNADENNIIINTDQIRMVFEGVIDLVPVQGEEGSSLSIATKLTSDAILDLIEAARVGVAR